MLIRLAVFLLESSPWLRRLLWRWWYGRLAKRYTAGDWTFMNYGHVPPAGGPTLVLNPEDAADRLCIQLYHRVAAASPLAGKEVLEVGSVPVSLTPSSSPSRTPAAAISAKRPARFPRTIWVCG